jgi:hypothetical protein
MLDRWVRPEEPAQPRAARPVLRPGDPDWRRRWLAAVRRRMQVSPFGEGCMRAARVATLGGDPALWAEIRSAEAAYARGEGERFVPGQRPQDGAGL